MNLSSVRVRLTLWNMAVMALVLGGFGFALYFGVKGLVERSADRELHRMATRQVQRWRAGEILPLRPGFVRGMGGPFGPGQAPGDGGEGPQIGPGRRFAAVLADPQRVRFISRDGGPLIPGTGDVALDEDGYRRGLAGTQVFNTVWRRREEGDVEELRVISVPLLRPLRPDPGAPMDVEGVAQLGLPMTDQRRVLAGLRTALLTLVPLVLIVSGVGGAWLTTRALAPVRAISAAAARLGVDDLSSRLEVVGKDEFSELASTFNGMLARLEEGFRRQEQAIEQQRRFAADASHELRTPLTTIKANTSLALLGERTPAEYREVLEEVDRSTDRMTRLIQDLLLLARSDAGQLALQLVEVHLPGLVEEVSREFRGAGFPVLELTMPEPAPVIRGEPEHLGRLLRNLLSNAVRHTPVSGRITVRTFIRDGLGVLEVQDTGEGIPEEHLALVCDRFYRVDSARSRAAGGTGLGLSICQGIVAAHQGTLEIQSARGVGTTVTVILPLMLPAAFVEAPRSVEDSCSTS